MAAALLLGGCGTVDLLWQAGLGHLDLVTLAQPVERLVHSERTPPKLRALLSEVEPIKRFGASQGLEISDSYNSYVQLDRDAAVWTVTACAPLAFEPHLWRFPIVGAVPYIGFFDRIEAEQYANELAAAALDVNVRGASAYSTLGWFDDPLLSTMLAKGPHVYGSLVNVVIHEAVHATVFVSGQAPFNEGLASFVADRMTPQYLAGRFGTQSVHYRAYLQADTRWRQRRALLVQTYERLAALYQLSIPEHEMLSQKQRILDETRNQLGWEGTLNNATLIDLRTYRLGALELEALWRACGRDWQSFLEITQTLRPTDFQTDQDENLAAVLRPLHGQCRKVALR